MTRAVLRRIWDRWRSGFWFTPLIMTVLALLLAELMLSIDEVAPLAALELGRFIADIDPQQARSLLFTLAGTVLGISGIVYSLLTAPLSIAASQFGARLLRLFLRDRTTKFVLGVFVATFVYCIAGLASYLGAAVNSSS